MKQATIQITFEEEKLRALRRYIAKRDSTLEYISDCEQDEPVRKPQKKSEAQV